MESVQYYEGALWITIETCPLKISWPTFGLLAGVVAASVICLKQLKPKMFHSCFRDFFG